MEPVIVFVSEYLKAFLENNAATLAGAVALVILLTGWIGNFFKLDMSKILFKGLSVGQLMSWIISIALAVVGHLFNVALFFGLNWLWTFIYALAIGLAANGVFDIDFIKLILEKIGALTPKQKASLAANKSIK